MCIYICVYWHIKYVYTYHYIIHPIFSGRPVLPFRSGLAHRRDGIGWILKGAAVAHGDLHALAEPVSEVTVRG